MPRYVDGSTRRLAQLTGDYDPDGLAHFNFTSRWGCVGVDLGANTIHDDATFVYFGDVVTPDPLKSLYDTDLIAFIDHFRAMPGGGIAAAHQIDDHQLDVFFVDERGRLYVSWVNDGGIWQGPVRISPAGVAPAGASVATEHQVDNRRLDVCFFGNDGALHVSWAIDGDAWQGPDRVSPPRLAPPGGRLAAAHQTSDDQLDVLFIGNDGALHVAWVVGKGSWKQPVGISPPAIAPPGAGIAAAPQVDRRQLDVFFIGNDGALHVSWVVEGGIWQGPVAISRPGVAPAGANVTTAYQVDHHQLDVFFIGNDGALHVSWVVDGGVWQGPVAITPPGVAPKGASVTAEHQVDHHQLDVFFIGNDGGLHVSWVVDYGTWQGPVRISRPGVAPSGTALAAIHQTSKNQLDVVFIGHDRGLNVSWVNAGEAWRDAVTVSDGVRLTPIRAADHFYPFTYVENHVEHRIPSDGTPTGAFSYDGRMFVTFFHNPPSGEYFSGLSVSADPFRPQPFDLLFRVSTAQEPRFFQIAPCVIDNAEYKDALPQRDGDGLILFGHGWNQQAQANGVHLAWLPLRRGQMPRRDDIRYYVAGGSPPWSANQNAATLFFKTEDWSSISVGRIPSTGHWMLLHQTCGGRQFTQSFTGPIIARVARAPWEIVIAAPLPIFDPVREHAFGRYMHHDDLQRFPDINGLANSEPRIGHPGFAYGPYLLNHYTSCEGDPPTATVHYLMSTGTPYQVQVMESRIAGLKAGRVRTTPWTSLVTDTPLQEYPRPQLTRPEWLNLNGPWQFKADASLNTPPIEEVLSGTVLVPFPIESALSRIEKSDARFMWYRRTVQIPQAWQGRRIHLNFGAVNWRADVWISGRAIGSHQGGYDAFSFDITDALREGENEILVGVDSPLDAAVIPLGKQRRWPHDIFYTGASGIWQTVWLEPTTPGYIVRLDTTPDVEGGKLDVTVHSAGLFAQSVRVVVTAAGAPVADVRGRPGEVIRVPIASARLWSPEDPFLYDLTVSLTGPNVNDTVGSYFGMRSITTESVNGAARRLLNGRVVFQLGVLDQGYWPDGIYTAPTENALKFDLQQIKDLGFNTVRKHAKVEPARWYYWADRLGLLVWQDMPSPTVSLPQLLAPPPQPPADARPNFEAELRRVIEQLRSVTSIVQWEPFNESWGAYDRPRIAGLVKDLDPSRPVDTDSGGWRVIAQDENGADVIDGIHSVDDTLDDHVYPGPVGKTFENNDGPRMPGTTRAAVLSEFGGAGMSVPMHEWDAEAAFIKIDACPLYFTSEEFTAAYEQQLKVVGELNASKSLSGAIYVQLTDVENERDGMWTYDRRVLKLVRERVVWANLTARTAAATDRSQQHIFYRAGSAIEHILWDAAIEGLYAESWTAKTNAPAAAGNPATMVWPGQQHVFYRGTGGAIDHIFWDGHTSRVYVDSWTAKTNAPAAAGDPATLVWPNQQHVFYRGASGAINHLFWDQPADHVYFDQWQPNPQVPAAPAAAGDPATLVWPGQQHVFYRGTDGAIDHVFWDQPANHLYFDQWQPNPQVPAAPAAAGDPATLVWPNQQHVFYRGHDGAINHVFWDQPANRLFFDQWQPSPQVPHAPPAAGDPVTMVWPNQQHVFYRSADGAINHVFWDQPANRLFFDQWRPNPQVPHAPPAAGDVATMVTPHQQHVFYRSADGAINHIFWDERDDRLHFDRWTEKTHAPAASGDPSSMFTS